MIKVFSGEWRGLGEQDRGLSLMMDFGSGTFSICFMVPKLAYFFCIVLHC
jgi:hypothetical protein